MDTKYKFLIIGIVVGLLLGYFLMSRYTFLHIDANRISRCNNFTGECIWFEASKLEK